MYSGQSVSSLLTNSEYLLITCIFYVKPDDKLKAVFAFISSWVWHKDLGESPHDLWIYKEHPQWVKLHECNSFIKQCDISTNTHSLYSYWPDLIIRRFIDNSLDVTWLWLNY